MSFPASFPRSFHRSFELRVSRYQLRTPPPHFAISTFSFDLGVLGGSLQSGLSSVDWRLALSRRPVNLRHLRNLRIVHPASLAGPR